MQLPEGVPADLTVSELEEMACRQQQQIESQRQLLAAKEQRLRFLKQHEAKHQLVATEHERLRKLRDKVETQEQKLRKLRALRGQVDQTKLNNVSLSKYTVYQGPVLPKYESEGMSTSVYECKRGMQD